MLLEGLDSNDPLVLQIKEAQESVLERFTGKSIYKNNGQRVVEGQRAIQAASDVLLGWTRAVGVERRCARLLRTPIVGRQRFNQFGYHIQQAAHQLSENLRENTRSISCAHRKSICYCRIFGEKRRVSKAIVQFSQAYADQNEAGYQLFMKEYQANSAS